MMLGVFAGLHDFQIGERVIERVAVLVMDEVTTRDRTVRTRPNSAMQRSVTAPEIDPPVSIRMTWVTSVFAALEDDCLTHGRIISP
jgi:hypothetical protein